MLLTNKTFVQISAVLFLTLFSINNLSSQDQERGIFFDKKEYKHEPLPTYQESKDSLPVPILDSHKEWIDLYWNAWKIAFSKLKSPAAGSPFVSNWIDEGLSPQIFQWDTNFMAMFGRYADHIFSFIGSHDNFYARQHSDGMINRVINEADGVDHWWGQGRDNARAINPPLFSWAEVQTYLVTGDKSRFALVLKPLEEYVKWIETYRCGRDTPHSLYWSNGQASGMDNTPRDLSRTPSEEGWDCHSAIDHVGWVDMSSQMVICYRDLAYICKELGLNNKSLKYSKLADSVSLRINKWLWDENQGLYFDVDPKGVKDKWITAATFWPMLAGISSKEQSVKLVKNLKDPNLFWRPIPIPTLAANQDCYDKMGCYWNGGVWAPTNYMIVEGLKKYGYRETAIEISKKYLNALSQVYHKTNTLWEVYSPEIYSPATNASGVNLVEPDFVGWTGLGPISMLIETIIGIEMDAPQNTITWNITEKFRHGISKLRFNGGVVSLLATPISNGYEISLQSNKSITVVINIDGKKEKIGLKANVPVNKIVSQ